MRILSNTKEVVLYEITIVKTNKGNVVVKDIINNKDEVIDNATKITKLHLI